MRCHGKTDRPAATSRKTAQAIGRLAIGVCAIGVCAIGLGLAGCQPPPPPPVVVPPPPPPAVMSPDNYSAMKAAYLKANPDARVGRVMAVLTRDGQLAAGDLPTADFKPGDVVSIIDANMGLLANGTVMHVDPDLVYVKYEPLTVGSRAPMKGDIVIRAFTPDRAKYR